MHDEPWSRFRSLRRPNVRDSNQLCPGRHTNDCMGSPTNNESERWSGSMAAAAYNEELIKHKLVTWRIIAPIRKTYSYERRNLHSRSWLNRIVNYRWRFVWRLSEGLVPSREDGHSISTLYHRCAVGAGSTTPGCNWRDVKSTYSE